MKRTFVESSSFAKRINQVGVAVLKEVQEEILKDPLAGSVIAGTGGLRKIRIGDASRGKGKRGGYRVIYLDLPRVEKVHLLVLYDKGAKSDISKDEEKVLKNLVAILKREAGHEKD